MPMSAYLRAVALLICAGVALFASAGSFAIAAFWVYLAILAVVFIVAFTMLDRGLLQERMRPGGRPTPLGLRLLNVVLLAHWIALEVGSRNLVIASRALCGVVKPHAKN